MHNLTVIIPCFNEERSVSNALSELSSVLDQCTTVREWQIVLVDDGSTDGTAAAAAKADFVTLIQHTENRGYGAALKTGILHARHSHICIIDCDGTYPAERIGDLHAKLIEEDLDMVVGARTGDDVHIPLVRRPAKWVLKKLAKVIAAKDIPDLNSGLRIFKRELALHFFPILPEGFSFTTTITMAMLEGGYRFDYVPIDYHPRVGTSSIRPIYDSLNFALLIIRIALYFAPLKIFIPVSIALMCMAICWAAFSYFALGQLADVSTLVIAMTSLQVAMLGLVADLINSRLPNSYRKPPLEQIQKTSASGNSA